jgi:hypothetical protein
VETALPTLTLQVDQLNGSSVIAVLRFPCHEDLYPYAHASVLGHELRAKSLLSLSARFSFSLAFLRSILWTHPPGVLDAAYVPFKGSRWARARRYEAL